MKRPYTNILAAAALMLTAGSVSLQAQSAPQGSGAAAITLVDALGDSLVRSYSVDDLIEFRSFYQDERARLESERLRLRDKGIADLEAFLRSHPESGVVDRVLFRLAELYYAKSQESYLLAQEAYGEKLDSLDAGFKIPQPVEPKKNYDRPLELYTRILENSPRSSLLDDAAYNVAFLQEDLGNRKLAFEKYEDFLRQFPDSPYQPDVMMRQAEYYFNPPVNDIEKAISIYKKILAFTDSPKYDEALYRLGWCHYRLNEYTTAISYFTMLADDVNRARRLDPKNQITNPSLQAESVEYIGISFLDYTGVEGAAAYLQQIGGRDYGIDVLRKIGDVYLEVKEDYTRAIEAYDLLLKLYPETDEAPLIHARIAEAYRHLEDARSTYAQRRAIFGRYQEGSDWWDANADPNARREAASLAEHAMRANINEVLAKARESEDANAYGQVIEDTRAYLKAFPEDTAAAKLHWNMALILDTKLNRREEALEEYLRISDLYWDTDWQTEAAMNAIAIAQDMAAASLDATRATDLQGMNIGDIRKRAAEDSAALRAELQLKPKPLSPGQQALARAIDNYIRLFPFKPETAARLSQAGSMYYNNNDFVNSLKYFKTLLRHFPDDSLAASAEYLVMESYFGKLDFDSVEIMAHRIRENNRDAQYVAKAGQRLAESIFLQAEGFAGTDKHFKAAEEYRRVAEEVPDAEFADLALFNAGLAYDSAKEFSRAIEIYTRLAQKYPASKHYLPALNNMALDYGELQDHLNAAIVFERLAREDTTAGKAEAHLFNASVFFAKAGEWRRALTVNRRFVDRFPKSDDADDLFYDIANYHLKLNEFDEANAIYGEYADRFPESPRVVEISFRRAEYFEKQGEPAAAIREYENTIRRSDKFIREQKDGNAYFAAEALYRLTELKFRRYSQIEFKLPKPSLRAAKDEKKRLLLELVNSYTKVAGYGTIRLYESTHKIGLVYELFAQTWVQQDIPATSEEQRIVARKEINAAAVELFERAIDAYKNSVKVLTGVSDRYRSTAAAADTSAAAARQAGGKVSSADTTLQVAGRWISASREKISKNIHDMAEINFASVRSLLQAPVPPGLDAATTLEFRNQILGQFVTPLVGQIVQAHTRNLAESRQLSLDNRWVEASRGKIIAASRLPGDAYAELARTALLEYAKRIAPYAQILPTDDVAALNMSDEMASLLEFAGTYSLTALESYRATLARGRSEAIVNHESRKVGDDAMAFAYRFATTSDSLGRDVNNRRREFEKFAKQTGEPHFEDGLLTFEDNAIALSDGHKESLALAYNISEEFQIHGGVADKIVQQLVRSDPEQYASVMRLSIAEQRIVSDAEWRGQFNATSGWTQPGYDDTPWHAPDAIDSAAAFRPYGAQAIWLSGAQADSAQPAASIGGMLSLRRSFFVDGLPVSGQVQIVAPVSYQFFFNGSLIAEIAEPGGAPQVHEFGTFLQDGENVIALRFPGNAPAASRIEVLAFVKSLPGWEKRRSELGTQRKREEENLLFDKGILIKKQ